jgi:hypothetical protein
MNKKIFFFLIFLVIIFFTLIWNNFIFTEKDFYKAPKLLPPIIPKENEEKN